MQRRDRVYWHIRKFDTGFFFYLFNLLCLPAAFSQAAHPVFHHLTTSHGLSSNKVESIIQDRRGFYWIATQNGLNRFDGTTFTIYRHDPADTTSLTHDHCTALAEGPDGDIWIATYKGISRFRVSTGKFQRIYLEHPDRNFEISNRLQNLVFDNAGNLWLASIGLWRLHLPGGKAEVFLPDPGNQASISDGNLITQLSFDSIRNGIWFSTGTYLNFYDLQQKEFYHRRYNPKQWALLDEADGAEFTLDHQHRFWFRKKETQTLSVYDFTSHKIQDTGKKVMHGIKLISPDYHDRIWIFYWQYGAEIFDPKTNQTDTAYFKKHHQHSAISEKANSLFIDRYQHYWIASGEGISIYDEEHQYFQLYQLNANEKNVTGEPLRINAIAQTAPNHLWLGTTLGFYQYDLLTGQYHKIELRSTSPNITSMAVQNETLWISANNELIQFDPKKNSVLYRHTLPSAIYSIEPGMDQDVWIGLWVGGVYRLHLEDQSMEHFSSKDETPTKLKSNFVICGLVLGDAYWVGYNGGFGFSKYTNGWTHFHPKDEDPVHESAGTITVIAEGEKGTLWLGTHGSGLLYFNPQTNTYRHYRQQQGLNSNYINSILTDEKKHLWISTADGMNYFNPSKQLIIPLDIGLVFPENDFIANGAPGVDGKLYFFSQQNIISIDPGRFAPDVASQQLVISSFKIFDQDKPLASIDSSLELSYKENFFTFGFSSIKTRPGQSVTYAYRLKGFDKDWIITQNPFASYTNVPDGKYVFEVKAANAEGDWSDALLGIPVTINPPFWRTWWFSSLLTFAILLCLYAWHRYRIQQVRKIYTVRNKISRDLHDDIGASLSSIHFYTSVAEKEIEKDPGKTKTVLRQINQRSRQIIENISDIVWANQTQQQDTSSLAGRIKNYGYDLLTQQNIDCKYDLDPRVEKKLTSPEARRNILLIIKEAMNNMAKYSDARKGEVEVKLNGSHLIIDIRDDGKGFDPVTKKPGNGLQNMRTRAETLGGTLSFETGEGLGTAIHCRIPLPNISEK